LQLVYSLWNLPDVYVCQAFSTALYLEFRLSLVGYRAGLLEITAPCPEDNLRLGFTGVAFGAATSLSMKLCCDVDAGLTLGNIGFVSPEILRMHHRDRALPSFAPRPTIAWIGRQANIGHEWGLQKPHQRSKVAL
jgi:hypothetical protein